MPCLVTSNFFVISDLHYDIDYQGNYNETYLCHSELIKGHNFVPVPTDNIQNIVRPYCDSSLLLMVKLFQEMQSIDSSPEFILILGDTIGHYTTALLQPDGTYNPDIDINLVKQSYINIKNLITSLFPSTQVIQMIGNNDAYSDYKMPVGWDKMQYLDFLYTLWKPLAQNISPSFFKEGYYTTTTASGYTIIVLNSIIFGIAYNVTTEGDIEMLWFKEQLMLYNNIIIAMHIPPGVSIYNGGSQSWNEIYSQEFLDLIEMYQSNITAIFTGHYHAGLFRFAGAVPIIVNPSISPLFGNNPGFRYYNLKEMDYTEYTYNAFSPSNFWSFSSFSETYGYPMDFSRLLGDIKSGTVTIQQYIERVVGWWILPDYNPADLYKVVFGNICNNTELVKQVTICSSENMIFSDFEECL